MSNTEHEAARRLLAEARTAGLEFELGDTCELRWQGPGDAVDAFRRHIDTTFNDAARDEVFRHIEVLIRREATDARRAADRIIDRVRQRAATRRTS